MAQFSLTNVSDKHHLVEFKMNQTDEGWFGYDLETAGNVYMNEEETLLGVCLATPKGPVISCVGSTESIEFRDFPLYDESPFRGTVYINGREFVSSNGDYLISFLRDHDEIPNLISLEYDDDDYDNRRLTIRNRTSDSLTMAIKFNNSSDLRDYDFEPEQENTTYNVDDSASTLMFCLSRPISVHIDGPYNLFTDQTYSFYIEISNAPSSLQEGDIEVYYESDLIDFKNAGIDYTNEDGGAYSFYFIPNTEGRVSFSIYYKGRLLEENSYTIRKAPKLNISLSDLKEYNYKDTTFTPSATISDGTSPSRVYYEFENIYNAWPSYATYSVLGLDYYGTKIECKYPGQGKVRGYTYHSGTGLYLYSDWITINVFYVNFSTNNLSSSVALDMLQPYTYKIVIDGAPELPPGWKVQIESQSVDYTSYFTDKTTYAEGLINITITPFQISRYGVSARIGVRDENDGNRDGFYFSVYVSEFNGDIAAYSLTPSGDTVRIIGKVFTYEDINSIKVEKIIDNQENTVTSTVNLDSNKNFDFNVKISDWADNVTNKRLRLTATRPSGSTFDIIVYVRNTSPLVIKLDKRNTAILTNSESISTYSRVLVEYEDGSLSFPINRFGYRVFNLSESTSEYPVLKLHNELNTAYSTRSGRFRISDEDVSKPSLVEIISFGTGQLVAAPSFYNCRGLVKVPSSIPSEWTSTSNMFQECRSLNDSAIASWSMKNIRNADLMFYGATSFEVDLSKWCVSNLSYTPSGFSNDTKITSAMRPIWGTCPVG